MKRKESDNMKISCQMEDLLYGVQTVSRAVSGKNTLPVLAGILLWAEDNRLFLQSTNLELAIECFIPAEVEIPGKVVVPGKNFLDLVRFLPQGTISINLSDGNFLLSLLIGTGCRHFINEYLLEI